MAKQALSSGASIAVIGAGIVGVASAYALARQGYEVVVFDPAPPGEAGSSRTNAGHVAASDIYPLSTPGIHWKALKMLVNPDGPLKIPLRDMLVHIPWFWRFWRTSQGKRFETATNALNNLCRSSLAETIAMLDSAGMSDMLAHKGGVFIYNTKQSFNASKQGWAGKNARGFDSEEMDIERISQDIPSINNKFQYAVRAHQWAQVSDPLGIVRELVSAAKSKGVVFNTSRVDSLFERSDSVTLETHKGMFQTEAVVMAAGVNSVAFAKSCGDFLPMVAERGYNLTIPAPNIELNLPLVFADRGIVATQLTCGLRIGGWAEYAHPSRPANQNYFESIARISGELFPGLKLDGASHWMGNRPSLPDSVPVISRSGHARRVYYNCGHGHYGLTHAASSARILCQLITGEENSQAQQAYSINRFN
jgi:D-amino-acid dehydrogenase